LNFQKGSQGGKKILKKGKKYPPSLSISHLFHQTGLPKQDNRREDENIPTVRKLYFEFIMRKEIK